MAAEYKMCIHTPTAQVIVTNIARSFFEHKVNGISLGVRANVLGLGCFGFLNG